ncbi:hypothetical protein V5O48_002376 [Marasmius crinis-equi]|uniref:FMN hydroxy acid dehydrogenase domain-containing protein n=1 Tax=Marasmius crinis-equi TaxID=585013 RepID=A0ABR3FVU2_9AGAR
MAADNWNIPFLLSRSCTEYANGDPTSSRKRKCTLTVSENPWDALQTYGLIQQTTTIEGGVRRGTDVLKALCLGAKAVGFGRAFLYAQSAYGEAGCDKIIQILEREILTGMRLMGASTIKDLRPEMACDFSLFVNHRG